MEAKSRIGLNTITVTSIALGMIAVGVLGSGGYRVATGHWPWRQPRGRRHGQARPGVKSLKEAQEVVPFPILAPGYLPEGLEIGPLAVLSRPARGPGQPPGSYTGISINYSMDGRLVLFLEEELGEVYPGYAIGNARREGTVTVRSAEADLWRGESADGRAQQILVWQEPPGIRFHLISYLGREETLRIVDSLHPIVRESQPQRRR